MKSKTRQRSKASSKKLKPGVSLPEPFEVVAGSADALLSIAISGLSDEIEILSEAVQSLDASVSELTNELRSQRQ